MPLLVDDAHPEHVGQLESWMRSYKPEELFDENGRLLAELAELAPEGERRMGANPHTNGGLLLRDLRHAGLPRPRRGGARHRARSPRRTRWCSASSCATSSRLNDDQRNFRIFGPDETLSNLLGAVFEVTDRQWDAAHRRG